MSGVEQWAICPCGKCEHKGCGKQGSCELYKEYRKQIKKNKDKHHNENHHIYLVK
jgi:hypothetical protein